MASSQALFSSMRKKGQTAMMCVLCENDRKLKWKCLECELLMCERCRDKVHSKFASAEDHTIIDIKELGKRQSDSTPKPDLTRIKCDTHNGQNCCLYCETCDFLVCQTCVTKTHKKHEFKEIAHEYEIKLNKIKDGQKKIEKNIPGLIESQQKLKLFRSNEKLNYEKVKQEIHSRKKALVDEIQKHTNKLLTELDQIWHAVMHSIDSETKRMMDKQIQIQEQIGEVNKLLQVENAKDVFSVPVDIFNQKYFLVDIFNHKKEKHVLIKGVPRFHQGDKKAISKVLGKLDKVSLPINTESQVKAQFETDLSVITSVQTCPSGSFWICNYTSDIVQQVSITNDNLNVISNFDIKVFDAALLPSGDLLLSVNESSNLKIIQSGSTDVHDSVYTVSPLLPRAVHVTQDNKIILGAREMGPAVPAIGPRQVIIMDQTGQQEKVFQYDKHGKPLFTVPFRTNSNSKGFVAVIDIVSDEYRGRILVFDPEGGVRNIYTGHPDVNNEDDPFKPKDVVTTPSDNFVITDMDTHTLHILNSEGEIITFNDTMEMGVLLPYSMSFSTTGQLYIGCDTYTDSNEKAKLFIMNDFLF